MVLSVGVSDSSISKDAQAKSLIMKAWRERWTEVQWGINIRQLADAEEDGSFLADCILHQALSGPGPNSLVLSYLMYSIHSQIVTTSSVLASVSKYDAFHKPFCVASLLDLLDNIKELIIINDHQAKEDCMQLALSLQAVVCWLLSCMYSSLETLSDLISDFPAEAEDSKIVLKCRSLIDYFLNDEYICNLIQVANRDDEEQFLKIQRMSKEVDTFVEGHHQKDIAHVRMLISKLSAPKTPKSSQRILTLHKTHDELQMKVGNPSIQAIVMKTVLLKTSLPSAQDISTVVTELTLVKQLQNVDTVNFYAEILHSCLMGFVDSFGNKDHELTFVGFSLLQLPTLLKSLREQLTDNGDSFVKGLESFIMNESCLNKVDAKLHCCTFDHMLDSYSKISLISELDATNLKSLRAKHTSTFARQTSAQAPVIVRAETTIQPLFKTLEGDFQKSQDSILAVLCDLISNNDKTFNVILTAAACTGKLQPFTSKLIRLNQQSRQVSGEVSRAANTRALLFDVSFLMLCYVVQHHGQIALSFDEQDSFFEEWYKDCMVENHVAKNPDIIINRCEPNKVDLLLNQYMQNGAELKTSLVFWHELCVNSVGVIKEILTAWEADCITFIDVKRVLDLFRSKICSLPVCISAWLCAHIQITPEEKCDKARQILNYFLMPNPPPNTPPETPDHFKERNLLMTQIISRMMSCIQPADKTPASSPGLYNFESKPVAELYKQCWICMSQRGLIDVETTLNLNHLLQMSGPHFFVQNLIEEMLRLQHSQELAQRCDLLFGILHFDLKNCVPALVRVIVPTVLQFWTNDSSLMEPQIKALVSLTVDCILSYFYHATTVKIMEETKDDSDLEPQIKRRKFLDAPSSQKESLADLHQMLKEVYDDFHKLLHNISDATPAVVFILQFLEQLSMKTPAASLLTSLPHQVVTKLMSLLADDMNPDSLCGLFCLSNKSSRLNCAQALCRLKHHRYFYEREPSPRSFSPAPGS